MQRKLHSSSLNLHTTREPQAPYPPNIDEESNPERESAGQFTSETTLPGHLHKAQSLNVLSGTWSQTQVKRDAMTADGRTRSMSTESSLSDFSSSSDLSSSLSEEEPSQGRPEDQPDTSDSGRRSSDTSLSDRRGSDISTETVSVAPRVPTRPKTEEILTRCTTMTRKAALATKARIQIQPELIQTR